MKNGQEGKGMDTWKEFRLFSSFSSPFFSFLSSCPLLLPVYFPFHRFTFSYARYMFVILICVHRYALTSILFITSGAHYYDLFIAVASALVIPYILLSISYSFLSFPISYIPPFVIQGHEGWIEEREQRMETQLNFFSF